MTPRERYNAYWQALPPDAQPLTYELWLERELIQAWAYLLVSDSMSVPKERVTDESEAQS